MTANNRMVQEIPCTRKLLMLRTCNSDWNAKRFSETLFDDLFKLHILAATQDKRDMFAWMKLDATRAISGFKNLRGVIEHGAELGLTETEIASAVECFQKQTDASSGEHFWIIMESSVAHTALREWLANGPAMVEVLNRHCDTLGLGQDTHAAQPELVPSDGGTPAQPATRTSADAGSLAMFVFSNGVQPPGPFE